MAITLDGTNGINNGDANITNVGDIAVDSISGDADSNTKITFEGSDVISFTTGGSERMRLISGGKLGLGTNSPSDFMLNVVRGSGMGTEPTWEITSGRNIALFETDQSEGYIVMGAPASGFSQLSFADAGNKAAGGIGYGHGNDMLRLRANGADRVRINSDGALLVARTTVGLDGSYGFSTEGDSYRTFLETNTDTCLYLNRHGNDGELVAFRQANVTEGSITVSGSTVSYNGGHLARWSQLTDNSVDLTIVKGTVLCNLDEMCEWKRVEFNNDYLVSEATEDQEAVYETRPFSESYDGDANVGDVIDWEFQGNTVQATVIQESNEQLNKTKVSDVEGDVNVAGVFVSWDDDGDMNIAMTGDMVIRIAQGTTVQRGDLLMSAGDGTAKPQGDDIVRSKTIAKVTSTHVSHIYDDGSYLVPCVLMAC